MQTEEPNPLGWGYYTPNHDGIMAGKEAHVIPSNDLHEHDLESTCWCAPEEDFDQDGELFWKHQAADGREAYEDGRRRLN